jgi:2-phosphoglycerate kinase
MTKWRQPRVSCTMSCMIYLIGGAPRCGKTILSKKLARRKNISCITTDALRAVVLNSMPKSQVRRKFPFVFLKGSEAESPESSLKTEVTEARSMWPGIKALIRQLIECEQDYVIEGVHLLPQLIRQFRGTKYQKNIKVLYLIKLDEDKIGQGLTRNTNEYDWLKPSLNNPAVIKNVAKMIRLKSEYIKRKAEQCGFPVVNTQNVFKKVIEKYSKQRW